VSSFPDLDKARGYYKELRDLFIYETGGRVDRMARTRVSALCRAAMRAVDDELCREYLHSVREHATDMFSNEAHLKWERNSFSGVYVLRLQILRALDSFNLRLNSIEEARQESHARPHSYSSFR
jgi:hypothetical protein